MTSIIISGACGKMGQAVASEIIKRGDCNIKAGVDRIKKDFEDYKVLNDFKGLTADVVIDFSNPSALDNLLDYGVRTGTPLVLATTGYDKKAIQKIDKASREIAIFRTANMSMGINLLIDLSKKAAKVLSDGFDIEIIEKHHNQKIDAPSGTALMIADGINKDFGEEYDYVYNRHEYRKNRDKNEIGIHSVRGGTISGEHEVIFAGDDEILTISHTALSKKILAKGALKAALFIVNMPPGLYNMNSLIQNSGKKEVKI